MQEQPETAQTPDDVYMKLGTPEEMRKICNSHQKAMKFVSREDKKRLEFTAGNMFRVIKSN